MVTMQTADNALKSFYLDAVTEALNFKVILYWRRSDKPPPTYGART